jgi:hypothetical protein
LRNRPNLHPLIVLDEEKAHSAKAVRAAEQKNALKRSGVAREVVENAASATRGEPMQAGE